MKNLKDDYCKCYICGKTFNNISNLILHKKYHTDEKFFLHLPFKCKICPMAFDNDLEMKKHIKSHPSKKYKCEICHRHYVVLMTLHKHLLKVHGILTK